MSSEVAERLLTMEEFLKLPDVDDARMELFDGRVVCMSKPGFIHGRTASRLSRRLDEFSAAESLGDVVVESGFLIRQSPDRTVAPDVAWVRRDRVAQGTNPDGFGAFVGAPDLAVEIISPNDKESEVSAKMFEYFAADTHRVWHVRPASRSVTVHRSNGDAHTYREGDVLGSDDAGFQVDGFVLPVDEIFT
jgi:Uma2 family endonuclease